MRMFEGAGPDYYSGTTRYSIPEEFQHTTSPSRPLPPVAESSSKSRDQEILKAIMPLRDSQKISHYSPRRFKSATNNPFPRPDDCLSHPGSKADNLEDEMWWIRGDRYLAGTCACRSCRLASGFEIQEWTFVPKSNIFFNTQAGKNPPLDFADEGIKSVLKSYESSEGVVREFCGKCGATVFWRKWRSELIDVSVGLLEAEEGARAEKWLEWWTERVSFEEGAVAHGRSLVDGLQKGIAAWGGKREAA
ncbi:Mss4-like protein [Cadophora sp. MPI-SDFR-AT-0126]|nr:Mss4-like protein [Leotiomycetes sp. MPI-SDFR-AT-0126]